MNTGNEIFAGLPCRRLTLPCGDMQRCGTILPGLVHSGTAVLHQQLNYGSMALVSSDMQGRGTILHGLVHSGTTLLHQQLNHGSMTILSSDMQWSETTLHDLMHKVRLTSTQPANLRY